MEEKFKLGLKAEEGEDPEVVKSMQQERRGNGAIRLQRNQEGREEAGKSSRGPVKALWSVLTGLNLLQNLPDFILEGAFWLLCGKQT